MRQDGLDGRAVVVGRTPLLGAGIRVRSLQEQAQSASEPEMLDLSDDHRARLVALVQANDRMPDEAKTRVLGQWAKPRVPAKLVARIEARAGG